MSDKQQPNNMLKNMRPLPKEVEKRVVKLTEGSAKARKSAARLAAVQVLYQIDMSGQNTKDALRDFINKRIGFELDGDVLVPADRDLLTLIVNGVCDKQVEIDDIVKGQLAKKEKDSIDPILEAILKCGAYELMAHHDIDAPIIISDYMNVVKAFYEDGAPTMVNAILDSISNGLR